MLIHSHRRPAAIVRRMSKEVADAVLKTRTKRHMVRARVSTQMKRQLEQLVVQRGEAEAVLVREAIKQYIEKNECSRKPPDA